MLGVQVVEVNESLHCTCTIFVQHRCRLSGIIDSAGYQAGNDLFTVRNYCRLAGIATKAGGQSGFQTDLIAGKQILRWNAMILRQPHS